MSPGMETEIELRLKWRHTWPEKEADFVAEVEGYGTVGRIYESLKPGSLEKDWFWCMNAHGPEISRNVGKLSGHTTTPREAAKLAEDAWFAAIEGSSLDVPVVSAKSANAYAAEKGRE